MQWVQSVRAGLRHRHHPAYHELRYEDLVQNPEPTLRALLNFLDIPWNNQILHPTPEDARPAAPDPFETRATESIFHTSVTRWHLDLPPQDQSAILPLITPTLIDAGYD